MTNSTGHAFECIVPPASVDRAQATDQVARCIISTVSAVTCGYCAYMCDLFLEVPAPLVTYDLRGAVHMQLNNGSLPKKMAGSVLESLSKSIEGCCVVLLYVPCQAMHSACSASGKQPQACTQA